VYFSSHMIFPNRSVSQVIEKPSPVFLSISWNCKIIEINHWDTFIICQIGPLRSMI
jgi:hypothetical protein